MNSRPQKKIQKPPFNHELHYNNIMACLEVLNDNIIFMMENLTHLDSMIHKIKKGEIHMSQELDSLNAAVARETDVTLSAITLIQGIAAKLEAASSGAVDNALLKSLADNLNANADALAAAVVANSIDVVGSTGGITS